MSSSALGKVTSLVKLVAAIAAGGLVLAAMLFPAFGGAGQAAKSTADIVNKVDPEFTAEAPQLVTTVLAADGSPIVNYYNYYRLPIPLDQMGEWMPKAIVAVEDKRFYEHAGVDTQGMFRAAVQNAVTGGVSQGASTITQQLVKNTLLYQADSQAERDAATEQSLGRKLREAKIALQLEKDFSKEQILEKYLNLMNMGNGAYGVRAASLTYFGVEPVNLTIDQAALLAGLVQNPTKFNPTHSPEAAKDRRDVVLKLMADQGQISEEEYQAAVATPITLSGTGKPSRSCADTANYGGFFCDYVWQYLTQNLGIPEATLKNGGLTIQTTLMPSYQVAATDAIVGASSSFKQNASIFGFGDNRIATMPILDVDSGNVLALGVNKRYGNDPNDPAQTNNNFPVLPASDGNGSTNKLFPATVALSQGTGWKFELTAKAPYTSQIMKRQGVNYAVSNASNGYPDRMPLDTALYMSSNTYFVALEDYIGSMKPIADMAYNMGLWAPGDTSARDTIAAEDRAAFTLGPDGVSPLRLATAYNTIANRGTKCEPTPIAAITGADGQPAVNPATGQPWFTPGSNCTANVVSQGVADTLNQILLKDVMPGNSGQTGERAYINGYQIAGKTGTAQDNRSYTFVGWTPDILAAVYAFSPTSNDTMPAPGGASGEGFGGGYPAQMWKLAMQNILPQIGSSSFPPANQQVAAGKTSVLSVDCVGQSPSNCQAMLEQSGHSGKDSGTPVDSTLPAGTVAAQDPPAGSSVSPGSTVTYSLSSGKAPAGQPCQPGQDPATGCVSQNPAGTVCATGQDPATGCIPPAPAGQPCVNGQDPATGCVAAASPTSSAAPADPNVNGGGGGNGNGVGNGNGNGNGNGGGNGGDD